MGGLYCPLTRPCQMRGEPTRRSAKKSSGEGKTLILYASVSVFIHTVCTLLDSTFTTVYPTLCFYTYTTNGNKASGCVYLLTGGTKTK